jgi:Na+/H+ antiporter NhaA
MIGIALVLAASSIAFKAVSFWNSLTFYPLTYFVMMKKLKVWINETIFYIYNL